MVIIIQLIVSDSSEDDGRDSEPMQVLMMDVL